MGLRHARVLSGLSDRFELVGVYDLRPDAAAPDYAPRLRSEEEALERAELLVIATPTAAHAATVARAIVAGRHVLVEKPLCPTAADATALAALSSGRGAARLFVGHSERFNPVVRVLTRLLRGESVRAIDALRAGRPSRPSDCGALVNLGVHDFDLAAYLGGAPVTVRAAIGACASREAGEDFAHVLFTTGDGATGHLCVDRTAPAKRRHIAIATDAWLYEGDLLSHRLVRVSRTSRSSGERSVVQLQLPLPLGEPLASQAVAIADALDGKPSREVASGHDGARAVALAEKAAALVWVGLSASPTPGAEAVPAGLAGERAERLVAARAPLLPRE